MVNSVEREGVRRELVMAMRSSSSTAANSKPPLHNFNLPFLKWGNQKQLRCVKINNESSNSDRARVKNSRSLTQLEDSESRQFKKPKSRKGFIEESKSRNGLILEKEDIFQVTDTLRFGFDKNQEKKLPVNGSDDDNVTDKLENEVGLMGTPVSVNNGGISPERPWNLRTRRAACKAPNLDVIDDGKAGNSSSLRSDTVKSPRLKEKEEEKDGKEERVKFSVALSKMEIEDDFMVLLGRRPARRPKKRPRYVQKQLDFVFPGLWLTEVSVDTYKVPELPDNNGKR